MNSVQNQIQKNLTAGIQKADFSFISCGKIISLSKVSSNAFLVIAFH
jgi:hypothetical protein